MIFICFINYCISNYITKYLLFKKVLFICTKKAIKLNLKAFSQIILNIIVLKIYTHTIHHIFHLDEEADWGKTLY